MPYVTGIERSGFERGRKEGLYQGLKLSCRLLELVLETKFAAPGLARMDTIRPVHELEKLNKLPEAIRASATLEDLRGRLEQLLGHKGAGESRAGESTVGEATVSCTS